MLHTRSVLISVVYPFLDYPCDNVLPEPFELRTGQTFVIFNLRFAYPILIHVASDLIQLYIYRQFLSTISTSLDESSLLVGCSYFQLFTKIIFPLLAPATATVAIIKYMSIINDMYFPYLYMPGNRQRTLTTFLMDYANAQ